MEQIHKSCGSQVFDVHYHTAKREHDSGLPPSLMLQIGVSPEDAGSEAALLRLACKLAADFPHEASIDALIFDDKESARSLALYAQDQRNHGTFLWHLRAHYRLDRNRKRTIRRYSVAIR